ncbi:hypothetical protein H8K90_15400 [Winogradskyella echinorum]|uniref:DUF1735 domain-containing protein n=1 Tax=Winogradskyella echinorum TaxID=538189 RepID=A0ABR6Y4Y3_9FLAO|nr:DUF6452 family protein [Winogradskyella echinorum]MBC3847783.1 hypothetical protein [Winogradskyella echinorum]MBC5752131.1 hypothetical protein [Winogradskyella echinorum]
MKTKYNIIYILSLIALLNLQNCERDDICAESTITTPRLLIEFYDIESPDDLKSVPRLTVYGEGLVVEPTEDSDTTIVYNVNVSAAELPLKIEPEAGEERTTTRFVLEKDTNLRLDTDDTTNSNIDILEITYLSEEIYVSRACGYRSIFNELEMSFDNDGDTWISSITVDETQIENENTVHVRIFH